MVLTRTTTVMLCSIVLVATPASARPLKDGTLNKAPASSETLRPVGDTAGYTDVSARRRHSTKRYQPRRHVTRYRHARYARLASQRRYAGAARHNIAANAYASAGDYQAASGASLGGGGLISEARRYLGTNPTGRGSLWCGHFMNLVLQRSGYRSSNSNTARSFANYGTRVSGPQVGAIAVMARGRGGGHVGIVSGVDPNGNPIIISGNHNRRVAESVYSRGRIFAYVMP